MCENYNPDAYRDDGNCKDCCVKGDVNGDGGVNIFDLVIGVGSFQAIEETSVAAICD